MADSQNHLGNITQNGAHNLPDKGNNLRNDFDEFQYNGQNPNDR
jgi:uncharacterized protein CbrC (UPF0167 family)